MKTLLDTNFLIALILEKDVYHARATTALGSLGNYQPLVVAPVLVELFFLVNARSTYANAIKAIQLARKQFEIIALTEADMIRMEEIMTQYQSAKLDYADTAIMAVAERLNITKVYTFDRRDFSIVRPKHAPAFELLP